MEKEVCEEMSPPPQPVDSPEDTPLSESDPNQKPGSFSPQTFRCSVARAGFSSSMFILIEKKATRQWAAWTRQEEESFFNALRQVGKVRCISSRCNVTLRFTTAYWAYYLADG